MSHDATVAPCPPPPHLAAFERGALDDAELVAVAEHVGRCARCQAALAALPGDPADSLQRALKRLGRGADTARALDTKRASAPDAGTTGAFVPAPDPHVTRARGEEAEEPSATRARGARPEDPAGTQARAPDARGPEPADGPREANTFGKFELLGKLGEGGMGVVYKARDPLKRAVALKLIKGLLTPTDRRRFAAEAEAVARIGHPNVVLIYDYGETDGQPYASLEFVPGGSLADRLKATLPDHRSAAQVMVGICRGVQAAHDLNLVHRDLKPANVLVSGDPARPLGECVPKVTDFGLAKFLDADGDDSRANAVMGTPSYMAPEQAEGRADLGPAADVYALGATFYDLLTGRAPFRGTTVHETLKLVREQEPVPPRQLQPKVPRDLETICLKCLEKDPARRYASAAAVADELQRFLNGEPIHARPVSRPEKLWRWAKRKPTQAALVALAGFTAVALLGGTFWFLDAKRRTEVAESEAERDRAERETAVVRQQSAEELKRASDYFALTASAREHVTGRETGWAWAAADEVRAAAGIDTPARNPADLRSVLVSCLAGTDVREARVLAPNFHSRAVCFHPNGRWVFFGEGRVGGALLGTLAVLVIDFETGKTVHKLSFPAGLANTLLDPRPDMTNAVAVSPDGRWLVATARSGSVHRWDLRAEKLEPVSWKPDPAPPGKTTECYDAAFAPDGSALYLSTRHEQTKSGSVTRWDTATWKQTARHACEPGAGTLCVRPNGETVYCSGDVGRGRTLDPLTLQKRAELSGCGVVCVSPCWRVVAVANDDRIDVRDATTGAPVRSLRSPRDEHALPQNVAIKGMQFSWDGRLLGVWSEHQRYLFVWDVLTGELATQWRAPEGSFDCAFDPTSRFLVVVGREKATVLEVAGQREHRALEVDPYRVLAAAVAPAGHALGTVAATNSTARTRGAPAAWYLADPGTHTRAWRDDWFGFDNTTGHAAFDRSGALFAAIAEGEVRAFDRRFGHRRAYRYEAEELTRGAFDASGRLWFVAGKHVHSAPLPFADQKSLRWENPTAKITGLGALTALDAGKSWVAVGGLDGALRLFRTAVPDGATAPPFEKAATVESRVGLRAVALSPDEKVALIGTESGKLFVHTIPECTELVSWPAHRDAVSAVVWLAPNLFASGGADRAVRFWSWDGKQARELWTQRTARAVSGLSASADGRVLSVTCESERGVHVWDMGALARTFAEYKLAIDAPAVWAVPRLPLPEPPPALPDESKWPANGVRLEYFADENLRALRAVALEPSVYRNWGLGAPRAHVPHRFSARFSTFLKAPAAGKYEFRLLAGNCARVWLDGKVVAERWDPKADGDANLTFAADLTGEPHELRVEYARGWEGTAHVALFWARPGAFAEQPVTDGNLFHTRGAARAARVPAVPAPTNEELRLAADGAKEFTAVALAPADGFVAAGSAEGGVYLWDRKGKALFAVPKAHGGPVRAVAVSPDGSRVLSASAADGLMVWDATGKQLARHAGHGGTGTIAFAPDGASVVTAGADKAARVWGTVKLDTRAVANLDFVPTAARWFGDSVHLAGDGTGATWNPSAAKQTALAGWRGPALALTKGAVFTNEQTEGWERGALRLFDAPTGAERWRLPFEGGIAATALAPDDRFVAVAPGAASDRPVRRDCAVGVWDSATGREVRRFVGHANAVRAVDFGKDAVATASADGTVRLWRWSPNP